MACIPSPFAPAGGFEYDPGVDRSGDQRHVYCFSGVDPDALDIDSLVYSALEIHTLSPSYMHSLLQY